MGNQPHNNSKLSDLPPVTEQSIAQANALRAAMRQWEVDLEEHLGACSICDDEAGVYCAIGQPMVDQMNKYMSELMVVDLPRVVADGKTALAKRYARIERAQEQFLKHNQRKQPKRVWQPPTAT